MNVVYADGKVGPAGRAHVTGPLGVDGFTYPNGTIRIHPEQKGPLTFHITYHDADPIDHVVDVK